jgi:hypothetical protein
MQRTTTRTGTIAGAASMARAYCSAANPMPHISDIISITYGHYNYMIALCRLFWHSAQYDRLLFERSMAVHMI